MIGENIANAVVSSPTLCRLGLRVSTQVVAQGADGCTRLSLRVEYMAYICVMVGSDNRVALRRARKPDQTFET
eukprot:1471152-Amphidinium_carterae.1